MKLIENIKFLLGLEKDDYNDLIYLYISKVTKRVKGFCNISDFSDLDEISQDAIDEFIEEKVYNIVNYKISTMGEATTGGVGEELANQGAIKSITRGSVKIEYNYDSVSSDTISTSASKASPELTDDEKKYLTQYRVLKF